MDWAPPAGAHPGWAPPMVIAEPTAPEAGEPRSGATLLLAIGGILLGALMFAVIGHLDRGGRLESDHAINLGIGLDVVFYATVAAAEVWFIRRLGIRLLWTRGRALPGAAIGLLAGSL